METCRELVVLGFVPEPIDGSKIAVLQDDRLRARRRGERSGDESVLVRFVFVPGQPDAGVFDVLAAVVEDREDVPGCARSNEVT